MQGAESAVEIFLARSYVDPYVRSLAEWLLEDIQPKVAAELKRQGVSEPFRFVEAKEPSGDQLVPEKVGSLIRQARGLLALCVPDSRGRVSNWVLAEIGYAYAHAKPMRAFLTKGAGASDPRHVDPQNDLGFLSHVGGESLPIEPDDFTERGQSRTRFDDRVVTYLVTWVRSILHLTEVTSNYCYRQYLKDVTVFGDGYGFVRFHVLVDVAKEIEFIPHFFGCDRSRRVPKIEDLARTFRKGEAFRRPSKDFFNFRPLSQAQALCVVEKQRKAMPAFIASNVKANANARFFGVGPASGARLQPGEYEYEYCYGLRKMFPKGFGADWTGALVSQAVVLDGSMGLRFMCESDEDFSRAQALDVRLECGKEDQGGFTSRTPQAEERRVTGLGVSYLFRRVMRPSPQNGTPIIVRWGSGDPGQVPAGHVPPAAESGVRQPADGAKAKGRRGRPNRGASTRRP